MEISHIEHIGIAVPSLEEAIPFYEKILGLKCFAVEEVADQKVKTAFFKVGQTKIELLEGTAPESAISKFIENNGGRGGIQHVAFAVADGVANALAEAEEKGCRLIDKAPRKGAEGLNIAFLHPKSTVVHSWNSARIPKRCDHHAKQSKLTINSKYLSAND